MEAIVIKILVLCLWTASDVSGGDDLLDTSQILWSKLVNGSSLDIGPLDPLLIPLVKVDQSQGDIRYRIILSDVEITGLNDSTIESVKIGRGRVNSNLSEYEAGYVSYSDAGKLDAIRYRFHTVSKNSKTDDSEDLRVKPIDDSDDESNRRSNFDRFKGSDFRRVSGDDNQSKQQQFSRIRIYADESRAPIQGRRNYQPSPVYYPSGNYDSQNQRPRFSQNYQNQREPAYNRNGSPQFENLRASSRQEYEESRKTDENQRRYPEYQASQPYRSAQRIQVSQEAQSQPQRQYTEETRYYQRFSSSPDNQRESAEAIRGQGQNSRLQSNQQRQEDEAYSRRAGVTASRLSSSRFSNQNRRTDDVDDLDCVGSQSGCVYRRPQNADSSRFNSQKASSRYTETSGDESRTFETTARFSAGEGNRARVRYPGPGEGVYARVPADRRGRPIPEDRSPQFSERLENQPGYIDIIYVDNNNRNDRNEKSRMRHFGNLRIDSTRDTTVYSFQDAVRDLENHRRFIIHNFTEGESLLKKNDRIRLVEETRRIEDLIRYAKSYQEKEGYFEEGMEIIYHYPSDNNNNSSAIESRRLKRAHEEEDDDDDIMHLVVKIRVPSMRVKAGYVLMGKVGEQVLQGDGRLEGNFSELVGDFTVEFKKTKDNTMIVRGARAKLEAGDKNFALEGMDEKGPVAEILSQGLVAAEAVAAMLADDLATKALSDKTSDSIIYKLYRELPE